MFFLFKGSDWHVCTFLKRRYWGQKFEDKNLQNYIVCLTIFRGGWCLPSLMTWHNRQQIPKEKLHQRMTEREFQSNFTFSSRLSFCIFLGGDDLGRFFAWGFVEGDKQTTTICGQDNTLCYLHQKIQHPACRWQIHYSFCWCHQFQVKLRCLVLAKSLPGQTCVSFSNE